MCSVEREPFVLEGDQVVIGRGSCSIYIILKQYVTWACHNRVEYRLYTYIFQQSVASWAKWRQDYRLEAVSRGSARQNLGSPTWPDNTDGRILVDRVGTRDIRGDIYSLRLQSMIVFTDGE